VLLRDAELANKLQLQRNNNGSTPLIVAAAAAGEQPAVFGALLAVAGADVLEASTHQGEPQGLRGGPPRQCLPQLAPGAAVHSP
jgi:hypothetical protein